MAWHGDNISEAAKATIEAVGAIGGLIAIGSDGQLAFAMNDVGMYRGRLVAGAEPETAIYADEALAELGRASGEDALVAVVARI